MILLPLLVRIDPPMRRQLLRQDPGSRRGVLQVVQHDHHRSRLGRGSKMDQRDVGGDGRRGRSGELEAADRWWN